MNRSLYGKAFRPPGELVEDADAVASQRGPRWGWLPTARVGHEAQTTDKLLVRSVQDSLVRSGLSRTEHTVAGGERLTLGKPGYYLQPTLFTEATNQMRISRPGSYYFAAGGGLGFGLAASVGVQLAQPDRPVVCVIGEGSVQYAVSAFWSAVAYKTPVTFLVVRNEEYGILKWFAEVEDVQGAPGLDLPKLDVAAIAEGYGITAHRVKDRDEVSGALAKSLASSQPELVEVPVTPGMALF